MDSINITTRHRVFWPRRRASISHSSSVYWMIWSNCAIRRYNVDCELQNFVYRLCKDGFGRGMEEGRRLYTFDSKDVW